MSKDTEKTPALDAYAIENQPSGNATLPEARIVDADLAEQGPASLGSFVCDAYQRAAGTTGSPYSPRSLESEAWRILRHYQETGLQSPRLPLDAARWVLRQCGYSEFEIVHGVGKGHEPGASSLIGKYHKSAQR